MTQQDQSHQNNEEAHGEHFQLKSMVRILATYPPYLRISRAVPDTTSFAQLKSTDRCVSAHVTLYLGDTPELHLHGFALTSGN